MKTTVSLKYLVTDGRLIDSAISNRQGYQRKHSFLEKTNNSIKGKMDSLWTPRNITSLDDGAIKQSTHQFHKKIFHLSKRLACSAEKKNTAENKKRIHIVNFTNIYTNICLKYISLFISSILSPRTTLSTEN